jgi:polyisoprenoid-binding protein YceI
MRYLLLLLLVAPSAHAEETLTLDPARSELVVKTHAAGIAKGFAHNHVVRATDVSGSVELDPANPESLEAFITVKVASLEVDAPAVRRRHGETSPLKDDDRRAVKESMLGETQLDERRFPDITFTSTRARREGGRLLLDGKLTLHGQTRRLTVPVKLTQRDGRTTAETRFSVRTSDFGIEPYSAALGMIRNADEVDFVIRLALAPAR